MAKAPSTTQRRTTSASGAAAAALRFARFVVSPNLGALIQFFDAVNALPAVTDPPLARLRQSDETWRTFSARSRVGAIDLDVLAALPPGTLGHEFARHMREQGLDPAALPTRAAANDEQYLWAHRYETHDIWHVLFGFGADVVGELGVQAVYAAQLPMRSSILLLGLGLARSAVVELDEYEARTDGIVRGWLLGRRAKPLFGVDWGTQWHEPLADLRRRYDIDVGGVDRLLAAWRRGVP